MKHCRIIILAAVLLLSLLPASVMATVDATIEIASVEGSVGDTVAIPIRISNCEQVDSLQFRINYDPAALKYRSLDSGDVFEGEFLVTNPQQAGLIQVATISAYGLTKEGTILTLHMEVLNNTGSAVTISDALCTSVDPEQDYFQSKAYLSVTNGGVSVAGNPLPQPKETPWIAETPAPTPTPEPTPTAEPTATPEATPAPTEVPAEQDTAEQKREGSSPLSLLIAAVAAMAILIVSMIFMKPKRK